MRPFEPPVISPLDKPETGQGETALGNQAFRQNLRSLLPNKSDEPLWRPFDFTQVGNVSGQGHTYFCEAGVPDYWLVTLLPIAGQAVNIYDGAEASGYPIIIGAGGMAQIPAHSEYLTVVNRSNLTLVGTILAVRGMTVQISPGTMT